MPKLLGAGADLKDSDTGLFKCKSDGMPNPDGASHQTTSASAYLGVGTKSNVD